MSKSREREEYFLGPLSFSNSHGPRGSTNDEILGARAGYYYACWREMQARAEQLKVEYGSWSQIPNRDRTRLANNLRYAGFLYIPGEGWSMPNSVALSSI